MQYFVLSPPCEGLPAFSSFWVGPSECSKDPAVFKDPPRPSIEAANIFLNNESSNPDRMVQRLHFLKMFYHREFGGRSKPDNIFVFRICGNFGH